MKETTGTRTPTIVDGVNIDELISADVLKEYRERGYWVSPKLFSNEQIAEMRAGAGTHVERRARFGDPVAVWRAGGGARLAQMCASSATRSGSAM